MNYRKRKRTIFIIVVIYIIVLSISAVGNTVSDSTYQAKNITGKTTGAALENKGFAAIFFRTVAALVFIILLVYGVSWVMKRLFLGQQRFTEKLPVRVVGSTFIGPKKSICLVDVQEKRLVLGVTDTSISFLTELEIPAQADDNSSQSHEVKATGFRSIFDSLMKGQGRVDNGK